MPKYKATNVVVVAAIDDGEETGDMFKVIQLNEEILAPNTTSSTLVLVKPCKSGSKECQE